MKRSELHKRIMDMLADYGDVYVTEDNGCSIGVKDGENHFFRIDILPDIEKINNWTDSYDKLSYTD